MNAQGKKITLTGEGLWARCMQHEIDHLDGVLFTDRVLPESLYWVTDETDTDGNYLQQPTTLDDALQVFQQRAH